MKLKNFINIYYSKEEKRWHASYKNFFLGYYNSKSKASELAPRKLAFHLKDSGEFSKRIQEEFKKD